MNCYKFNDINLNDEVTFEYTIDQSKMDAFRMITGDSNPLHCDLDYAKEQGYDENVVYGMLSASILSTLAGMYIPGKYSLIHSVEINFTKPVFISRCPLTVHAKVIEKDERVLITTLTIRMAEELTSYLKNLDIKVAYLHNEVKT